MILKYLHLYENTMCNTISQYMTPILTGKCSISRDLNIEPHLSSLRSPFPCISQFLQPAFFFLCSHHIIVVFLCLLPFVSLFHSSLILHFILFEYFLSYLRATICFGFLLEVANLKHHGGSPIP